MNREDMIKRDYALNVAVAKALGWFCWKFKSGDYRVIPPGGRDSYSQEHGEEVLCAWPDDAIISRNWLAFPDSWAMSLDKAFELDGECWIWHVHEYGERCGDTAWLGVKIWDDADILLAVVSISLVDFNSKLHAHAVARCMAFLEATAEVERLANMKVADVEL